MFDFGLSVTNVIKHQFWWHVSLREKLLIKCERGFCCICSRADNLIFCYNLVYNQLELYLVTVLMWHLFLSSTCENTRFGNRNSKLDEHICKLLPVVYGLLLGLLTDFFFFFFSWRSCFFPKRLHVSTPFVALSLLLASFWLILISPCMKPDTFHPALPTLFLFQGEYSTKTNTVPSTTSLWLFCCPSSFVHRRLGLDVFLGNTLTSSLTQ